jgi:hypothetical protein
MSGDHAAASLDAFFLRLHELTQRFLEKRPRWVDLNNDTGGAGLCEYASHEIVGFMAEFDLDGEVKEIWHRQWYGPESVPWCGQIEACNGYPGDPHFVAAFPHPDDGRLVVVDITARQFGEHLPFPWIWDTRKAAPSMPGPDPDLFAAVGGRLP